MKKPLICLALLCLALPVSVQAAMYRCTGENSVVYQDTPCQNGQAPINTASLPVNVMDSDSSGPVEFRQEPLPPSQLQSTSLALGMSDTEVLNLRGWGRPSKITRSKAHRAWREEWVYSSQNEQKLLFANGKLAGIE